MLTPAEHYTTMTSYLRKLYGDILYQRNGILHPMQIHLPEPEQVDDVDSLLGTLDERFPDPESFRIYNYALLQTLQNSGRNVYNGVTFSYKRLRINPLKLDARLGRYFDMLATCGTLEAELRDAAETRFIRLPMRSQYHREMDERRALINGAGRCAAIGGAVLLVYNERGTYKAMLARRSGKSATDPGFFHMLPAFIFQPSSADVQPTEWGVSYHIYREYLEELFGMPEAPADTPADHFQLHPAYIYLRELMARGDASLHLTGLVMNLLTLRPEFCALLLIRTPEWYERISAKDSDIPLNASAETDDGRITRIPIATDDALLAALPPDVHTIMPPQATAAMWLGVDLARERLEL